ncbi:MAG: hypothetical protein WBX25_03135 [Rhodomicrobium sp.]
MGKSLRRRFKANDGWYDLLPSQLATEHIKWENCNRIVRAVEAGAGRKEIAAIMGVTRVRINQMYRIGKRQRRSGLQSPLERYLDNRD